MKISEIKKTVTSNTLVLNEVRYIDQLIQNLLDANVDEIVIVDGGSQDGTWEKICYWAKETNKILPIQWPQRPGSEYKAGFNEVGRRNLMIEASSSDYILYIDADERVALNFKDTIDSTCDCIVLERMHFWNGRVRLNSQGDPVWSPEKQIRVFKRSAGFKYISTDKNGLHNSLSYNGIKIPLGHSRGKLFAFVAKLIRTGLRIKIGKAAIPARIYHYHYYNLANRKTNDLRAAEFNWPLKVVSENEICSMPGIVYVSDSGLNAEADEITRKYYL